MVESSRPLLRRLNGRFSTPPLRELTGWNRSDSDMRSLRYPRLPILSCILERRLSLNGTEPAVRACSFPSSAMCQQSRPAVLQRPSEAGQAHGASAEAATLGRHR